MGILNHLNKTADVMRAQVAESLLNIERQTNEIFAEAITRHFGGDPMDHVAEVTLEIQHGRSEIPRGPHTGLSSRVTCHRIRRNVDGKVLAEVKIIMAHDEIRLEGEIFK